MNELPTDPRVLSAAILTLEARVHALRAMVSVLLADNPKAVKALQLYSATIEENSLPFMLTDSQITQIREDIDGVLATLAELERIAGDQRPAGGVEGSQ